MEEWDAKDKTFLITGGASGMGADYADAFLEQGAKNVAILDIAEELGKATAERLNKAYGNKVVFLKCDVSKEEDITNAFDAVVAEFKQIDVIINNAGIMVDAPSIWRTASTVNWQGVVSFSFKGLEHMRKDEGGAGGTIINISSTTAISKGPMLPVYFGSKMAVLHFSQCLSMPPFFELTGVRVLVLCLGPTDTPLLQNKEMRAYDPKLLKHLHAIMSGLQIVVQKPASAVAAVVEMYKNGTPGSTWLSIDDKPAKDITSVIDGAFKDFQKAMTS